MRNRVPLTLGQELTVNMNLRVATLQETITVTGEAPLIETRATRLSLPIRAAGLGSLARRLSEGE